MVRGLVDGGVGRVLAWGQGIWVRGSLEAWSAA